MNIVIIKIKEVGGGATTSRPTEAFDELHEAHDVVDGGVGEHLDVVGADEGLEDVKDRSLGLSCMGGRDRGWWGRSLAGIQQVQPPTPNLDRQDPRTHGVLAQQVVLGVGLAAVHRPQGAEERPPA